MFEGNKLLKTFEIFVSSKLKASQNNLLPYLDGLADNGSAAIQYASRESHSLTTKHLALQKALHQDIKKRRAVVASKREGTARNKLAAKVESVLDGSEDISTLDIVDSDIVKIFRDLMTDRRQCPSILTSTLVTHYFADSDGGDDIPYYGRLMDVRYKRVKDKSYFHFSVTYWKLEETEADGVTEKHLQKDWLADLLLGDVIVM